MNRIIQRYGALIAGLTMFACLPSVSAAEWQVVKDTGSLLVERRAYQDSSLDELRGVTMLKASLNAVMALLRDASFNQEWVHRSGGAEILEEDGYARVYVYGVVDAPLPLQDRDTVVRFDYEQDPRTRSIHIDITNFADYIPEKEGYVRVPDFGGFWKLEPREGGRVEVTYQVRGKPGGWVPLWLANYAARVSVIRTLQNMGEVVKRYENAHSEAVFEASEG
jgi:hypothetical protein